MSGYVKGTLASLVLIAGTVAATLSASKYQKTPSTEPAPAKSDEHVHVVIAYSKPLNTTLGPPKIGGQKRLIDEADLRTADGKRIDVTLVGLSSQDMIERVMDGSLKAHAIVPSSDIYLDLADNEWKLRTDKPLVSERVTLLYQPYVLAVQRPMAEAMGWPEKEIGWSDVAEIARNGWKSVGHPEWGQLRLLDGNYQGLDDNLQMVVSISQSVLGGSKELTPEHLKDPKVAETFKVLDSASMWFPLRLEELVRYDNQGMAPQCHMAFLPEHVVIDLNDRHARMKTPPGWVAIYPKGGTIVEDITAGIVQREWVSKEQQEAAAVVIKGFLNPEIQKNLVGRGYRPAAEGVSLAAPFDRAWGVNPKAAAERAGMPSVDLALDCQDVWKKACAFKTGGVIKPVDTTDPVDPAAVRKAAATSGKGSRTSTPLTLCVRKTMPSTVFITQTADLEKKQRSGSGVIVDPRGFIATNAHVVGDNKEVSVRILHQIDKPLAADVIVVDPAQDVALLRLRDAGQYQAVAFTDSDTIEVGEQAIAIGNPMGYTGTVTLGIISARGRDIKMPTTTLTNLFQTDTAINPGNSGGPLVTIEGELIGLNVAVRDGASNIAFTIPSNKVRAVMAKNLPK